MPLAGITMIGVLVAISVAVSLERLINSAKRRAELRAREARKDDRAARMAKESVRSLMQGLAQKLHFALLHAASESEFGESISVQIVESPNIDSWFSVVAGRKLNGAELRSITLAGGESVETILAVVFDGRRERSKVIEVEFRKNQMEEGMYFHDEDIEKVIRICREQILSFSRSVRC